MFLRTISAGKL